MTGFKSASCCLTGKLSKNANINCTIIRDKQK